MKNIKLKIKEGCGCDSEPMPMKIKVAQKMPNAHQGEEARMHRTSLMKAAKYAVSLLDMTEDSDDLPEWLETKITKASDYLASAKHYLEGELEREAGALEEIDANATDEELADYTRKVTANMSQEERNEFYTQVTEYHKLYEELQGAITEDGELACPECLYEILSDAACGCPDLIPEAKYRGRKVKLNKPMRGDVKKFKVYVRDPKTGNIKKVNFGHGGSSARKKGEKTMRIRKSNPKARRNFRKRHNCKNPGPKTKARYWSCRKW